MRAAATMAATGIVVARFALAAQAAVKEAKLEVRTQKDGLSQFKPKDAPLGKLEGA